MNQIFLRALLAFGMNRQEIRTMVRDNPAKLMWLDEAPAGPHLNQLYSPPSPLAAP